MYLYEIIFGVGFLSGIVVYELILSDMNANESRTYKLLGLKIGGHIIAICIVGFIGYKVFCEITKLTTDSLSTWPLSLVLTAMITLLAFIIWSILMIVKSMND